MARWIFLDMDNTLYPYAPCNDYATARVVEELERRFGDGKALYGRGKQLTKQLLRGTAAEHSRLLYIARAIEIAIGKSDPGLALELHDLFWRSYFEKMVLSDGVRGFLEQGRLLGYRFAIITNLTTEIQYRKMLHLGITDLIDIVVTSEDVGQEKPAWPAYNRACELAGCAPDKAVMIGDDPTDIAGAIEGGMRGILLSDDTQWAALMDEIAQR